jgi:hypothetical protein
MLDKDNFPSDVARPFIALLRFTYKTQSRLPGPLMRSSIFKDETTTVLLSPATKQALGLRAQIEAIRVSAAESDVNDPDIFKARVQIAATSFQKFTLICAGKLFPEIDGHAHSRYSNLLGCCVQLFEQH